MPEAILHPKIWQPVAEQLALGEMPPNDQEITVYLLTTDAGDGHAHDFAIGDQPRLVAPGRPEVLLRDVRELGRVMTSRRDSLFTNAAVCLAAAAEAGSHRDKQDWKFCTPTAERKDLQRYTVARESPLLLNEIKPCSKATF